MMQMRAVLCLLAGILAPVCVAGTPSAAPRAVVTPVGPERVLFDAARDACDANDFPDVPARAFRRPDGTLVLFALHHSNRALAGTAPERLTSDCAAAFEAAGSPDPEAFDDRAWIAALWTEDGRTVHALLHHEYQADRHPGRCRLPAYLPCWWNAVLPARSDDGGRGFRRVGTDPVAVTPFGQHVGQGRHRGFFNPSGIVRRGAHLYTLIGTTGWSAAEGGFAQAAGVCLFRTADPADPRGWRAFDGKGFEARFDRPGARPCRPVGPFPAPVGALVRHQGGAFLAVYQARAGMPDNAGGTHPVSGFYASASMDLLAWGPPDLVLPVETLYDDLCGPRRTLGNYPALIDFAGAGPVLATVSDTADLLFARIPVAGCGPAGPRRLVAVKVRIGILR